ncbi:ATP phosphoribosyltransferase regulatory subunit [Virgibacillus indicus]|uniref:ATP phosphoribosyltransferase regulatory subunit n=1 Tax=Virgibacillus indicus TaxID=2024554 RepID=A0A265NAY8_9BACI|nr:ATP phosphoribosyltransferase regulatory subunit [Virgibacillus indicus]OZU88997.1 ATP phosphoribosyltransferase regulatory subunit [Virgibacillus indicus]
MPPYIVDTNNGTSVEDFQIREKLLAKLKKRFTTYGYKQIRTSTFEYYDMYSTVKGTVNKDDMIKVIDSSGKVLVLRPDVTIPITRMAAVSKQDSLRLFYVLDIFRQSIEQADTKENTQAGIEYFGENTSENNAEVLMLAIHTLKDLKLPNFKIEIGHAGFFKALIAEASLSQTEMDQLLALIQSKNIAEIELFLSELSINNDVKRAIQSIPMLYGNPTDVIRQAEEIILNEEMQLLLENLREVYEVLKNYGAEDSIVFNLGLINHMNYYSGIIFQGFADSVGKPVLMGGRYDNLGKQYGAAVPAIGFAFDVDLLLHALTRQEAFPDQAPSADMIIYYEKEKQKNALTTAFRLRSEGYQVLTFLTGTTNTIDSKSAIHYENNQNVLIHNNEKRTFTNFTELYENILQFGKGDM